MENYWEYYYGFNASNSIDARQDYDGDLVLNVDEVKAGSHPKDFWSVPLLSFSAVHLIFGFLISIAIAIGAISMKGFMIFQKKKQIALMEQLDAPDYPTAVKIQRLGLKNFAELQMEINKAKDVISEGRISFINGQLSYAVQLYEKALKQYSSYMDDQLIAETVFNIAWVQSEIDLLSRDDPVLEYFPLSPDENMNVSAFRSMLDALLAEGEKNWGLATKAWQAALDYPDLEIKHRGICQGSLVNLDFRDWLSNPIPPDYEKLTFQVEEWQEFCKKNSLIDVLCWAYLTHARIALAAMEFDVAENLFNDCLTTAEEHHILYYQELIQRETEVFKTHKNRIYALTREGEPISPSIQSQLVQEYLLKAKAIVKEEDIIRDQESEI